MDFSDDKPSRVLTVDDYLPFSGLSIERAIAALPPHLRVNYGTAWRWFMQMSGTSGSRMLGKRIPGVTADFPISAQRGIHVPSRTGIALSVTVARGSIYSATDQPLIHLPNDTWVLEYSAHRNNTGGETDTRWNEGLINCLKMGLPVGVFIQEAAGRYVRYLAFVEEFHSDRGVFTLHGPVTHSTESSFAVSDYLLPSLSTTVEYPEHSSVEELEQDNRKYASVQQAVREGQGRFRTLLMDAYDGQCACSGCDVVEVLQAAHIIGYRGYRSNAVSNGMLLRADIHLLFDSSLLSVDPGTHEFAISERLVGSEYERLGGRRLRVPRSRELRPDDAYLAAHHDKFLQIEHAS